MKFKYYVLNQGMKVVSGSNTVEGAKRSAIAKSKKYVNIKFGVFQASTNTLVKAYQNGNQVFYFGQD